MLRRHNSETNRRCEQLKHEEYFRKVHHTASSEVEGSNEEATTLRSKFNELISDKQRLDREMSEIRSSCCNQTEVSAMGENKEAFSNRYLVTINKYDSLKEDYENLQREYDALLESHNNAVDKLEFKQKEMNRLNQQIENMIADHNNVVLERNGLQQQCTQAVHKWNMTLREREELQQAFKKIQQQYEETMATRLKLNKDVKRLTEERNAAMQEYTLIMSERNAVHTEMEKLSGDLSQAIKKNKIIENQNKELLEQKKVMSYNIETLKREIAAALHDRDKAMKECDDFRLKFGKFSAKEESQREAYKSKYDLSYIRERDSSSKNSYEMPTASMELFNKCQNKTMHNLDQANKEIERLRKYIDKQHTELQEVLQEAEVSKRRRDWAFNERDKIVLQRETLKTMCEQLRKERDRDKINLAEALRDSDEYKRQRNKALKEVEMEANLEKESLLLHLNTTHNYSHDSAIDTDLQEWDTEMLNIDLNNMSSLDNLGLELVGGRDDPYYPNDKAIPVYVSSVCKGSIVEGKLKTNDCILRVNNLDCSNVSKRMVLDRIRLSGMKCNILVKRRRIGARSLFTTQLQLNNYDHGLMLEMGMYICKIIPGSLAAKEGNLAVGDRVLSINNKPLDGLKSTQEAMAILNGPSDTLVITTSKSTHCSSNCSGGSNKDVYKKYTNSSTQTDQRLNFVPNHYETRENRQSYPAVIKLETEKADPLMSKCSTLFRTKDLSRGRQILNADKTSNRISSPITFDQERDEAIAELDSVIESYHAKPRHQRGQLSSNHKKNKEPEKNGGTWPKARMGAVIIEHPTGTLMHPRKTRERLHLSLFQNQANYNVPQLPCSNIRTDTLSKDSTLQFPGKSPMSKEMLDFHAKNRANQFKVNGAVDVTDSSQSKSPQQIYSPPYCMTPFMPLPLRHRRTKLNSRHAPDTIPSSQNSEFMSLAGAYYFEPSYGTLSQFHHKYLPSVDSSYQKTRTTPREHTGPLFRSDIVPESYHRYEGGTFPRKKENQRFYKLLLSNSSVSSNNSGKLSSSSIEKSSERESPMPRIQVEVLDPRQNKRNSLPNYCWYKPPVGEERRVKIENSAEPLGISIRCLDNGTVFISSIADRSLASQVGLQVGDQLLEVCGINMRNATYEWAERVLGECKNNIFLHVQYNPHKFNQAAGSDSSASSGDECRSDRHSGSPTPCNSPKLGRKSTPSSSLNHSPYLHTVTTLNKPKHNDNKNESKENTEARYLILNTHKGSNLGISLVGGNAVGIFVHSVAVNSLAYNAGLRTGDLILEYNGTNLRQATAEEAAFELAKPSGKVSVLVQNELDRYNQIKDKPGDSFYIRALFDRTGDLRDSHQLQFRKDDILFVDNTMFNGVPGHWRATLVNQDGQMQQWGTIPSKYKVEEELLKRSLGDLEGDARRGTRRSFFRRKKQRTDSKELASFSNINMDGLSDSGNVHDENALASYQKVTKLYSETTQRPVLIVGPLADCVIDKLLTDFPDKFCKCIPEIKYASPAAIEKCLAGNIYIDYRKKGNAFECVTISSLKELCNTKCYCILDINLASVKRLHYHRIYPIVLLIKFKSTKQIKEVKDTRYLSDKTSAKAAKEMYEHATKLESEYKHYISVVIPAGVNVAYMCTQIKAAVDAEQNKTIWVPSSSP